MRQFSQLRTGRSMGERRRVCVSGEVSRVRRYSLLSAHVRRTYRRTSVELEPSIVCTIQATYTLPATLRVRKGVVARSLRNNGCRSDCRLCRPHGCADLRTNPSRGDDKPEDAGTIRGFWTSVGSILVTCAANGAAPCAAANRGFSPWTAVPRHALETAIVELLSSSICTARSRNPHVLLSEPGTPDGAARRRTRAAGTRLRDSGALTDHGFHAAKARLFR